MWLRLKSFQGSTWLLRVRLLGDFQFVFNILDIVLTSVYISRTESSCSENEEKNAGTGNEKSADDKSNMADDVNPEKKSSNQIVLSNRHKSLGIIRIR